MNGTFVFTSESVTEGHPDKLCDAFSDAVVGSYLWQDPLARVAVECAVSTGIVFVAVKQSTEGAVDVPRVIREVIADVGYSSPDFNARDCTVMTSVAELEAGRLARSEEDMEEEELARVAASTPITVFGYACDHTTSMLPLPIHLAHRLARRLAEVRRQRVLPWLSPDATTHVSVEFHERRPVRIHGVGIVTAQQKGNVPDLARLRTEVRETVVLPVFADEPLRPDARARIDVNPEGAFVGGGPSRHAGLTGRKAHVDTYGEYARNSSSALSGKDPSRIDRVGAYAARHVAKCVLAAGLAREAEVVLSYAPGQADPVSVQVDTFGSGACGNDVITERAWRAFDLRPAGIVRRFGLRSLARRHPDGFYRRLAAYGQMGRLDLDAPWERTTDAERLT